MSRILRGQHPVTRIQQSYMRAFKQGISRVSFFSNFLLRPMEISLKDTEEGLYQVMRYPNSLDKISELRSIRHPEDFLVQRGQPVAESQPAPQPASDDTSLLHVYTASRTRHIKLAICVCVYSEDIEMMKRTLSGIHANYIQFAKIGISPQEIAVVFIFDGIEKVSDSVETFFDNMDEESGFKWKNYGKSISQLEEVELLNGQFEEENLNVYTREELDELEKSLFSQQRKEYFRNLRLQQQVKKLKNRKDLIYEDLPEEVQKQYVLALRKEYEQFFAYLMDGQELREIKDEQILQRFRSKEEKEIRDKCIALALTETGFLVDRYFASRKDNALLYSYRYDLSDFMADQNATNNTRTAEAPAAADRRRNYLDVNDPQFRTPELKPYLFMCVKYSNGGKLSSQNWFFKGFCKQFQCDVAILLDVGLKPDKQALLKFYQHLSANQNCGGVCGYMGLAIERPFNELGYYQRERSLDCLSRFSDFFFDIQKAQRFQYHFAHMLDKPFEACFGFINVLPGAFSGYNMAQIRKKPDILKEYFKSLNAKEQKPVDLQVQESFWTLLLSIFLPRSWVLKHVVVAKDKITPYDSMKNKNVCLAEDRILCMGIHKEGMTMAFLPDAWATVDSVIDLQHLMAQRRRWINGSYFAFEKVTEEATICSSNWGFMLEMCYYLFNSAFTYISIALFFITLDMTANTFARDLFVPVLNRFYGVNSDVELSKCSFIGFNALQFALGVPHIISFFYVMMVGSMVFLSLKLNQTNQRFQKIYYVICSALGWYSILMYVMLCVSIFGFQRVLDIQKNPIVTNQTLKTLIYYILGIQVIPPIFFVLFVKRDFKYIWEVATSAPSYIFYAAAYIHILNLFAVCRIDDLSWGTKGLTADTGSEKDKVKQAWETQKYVYVSRYITWNVIAAIILKVLVMIPTVKPLVILIFSLLVGLSLVFRLIFALIYLIRYKCSDLLKNRETAQGLSKLIDDYYMRNQQRLIDEAVKRIEKEVQQDLQNPIPRVVGSTLKRKRKLRKKNMQQQLPAQNLIIREAEPHMEEQEQASRAQISRPLQRMEPPIILPAPNMPNSGARRLPPLQISPVLPNRPIDTENGSEPTSSNKDLGSADCLNDTNTFLEIGPKKQPTSKHPKNFKRF